MRFARAKARASYIASQLYTPMACYIAFGSYIRLRRVIKEKVMSESILRDKSKLFAKEIVLLCREIKEKSRENILSGQLLRSGTSIGANIHEAQYAQGTKDFISKFEISLKECYETEYWLELLFETNYITEDQYKPLLNQCGAIRRMLISTIKTIKEK